MSQNTHEAPDNQQSVTEDLTVDEDRGAAVRGGTSDVKWIRFRPGKDLEEAS